VAALQMNALRAAPTRFMISWLLCLVHSPARGTDRFFRVASPLGQEVLGRRPCCAPLPSGWSARPAVALAALQARPARASAALRRPCCVRFTSAWSARPVVALQVLPVGLRPRARQTCNGGGGHSGRYLPPGSPRLRLHHARVILGLRARQTCNGGGDHSGRYLPPGSPLLRRRHVRVVLDYRARQARNGGGGHFGRSLPPGSPLLRRRHVRVVLGLRFVETGTYCTQYF
jgi:hypothetical protein